MTTHEQEVEGKLFDSRLTTRLLWYVRPYRLYLGVALIGLFGMALITAYLPVLLKTAIDDYLVGGADTLSRAERVAGLTRVSLLFIGLSVVGFFLRYGESYCMSWVGERIIFDLRADIFSKVLRLPLRYMDRTPVGRLMTRVTSDVDAMQKMVTDGLVGLAADFFALFGIMGFMIYLSPRLAGTLFVVFPLLFVVLLVLNHRIRRSHREVRRRQSALNAYLQEMITGMLTVQLFNREPAVRKRFDQLNGDLRKGWIESVRWFSYFFPSMELLSALSFALVFTVGGWMILGDVGGVTIGVLAAFLVYVRDFFRPLEDLSDKSNIFQSAMASSERIFTLLDEPEDIRDPVEPVEIHAFRGEVEFEGTWFAYVDEDWVLKDVSFRIEPGESIAMVGATGAGKTSIISLIARFYDVQRGAVKVDGRDVRAYRPVDLRRRIGMVLQDPFIFSGSIADNIGMHNPNLSREEIVQAARYVNASRFIEALPDAYDTHVQERGITLSTGQKQLLALARALVQNPDILLILDEATANVDTESELLIQDALRKLMRGRTSIIIAHRLSTIRGVDRIFVLRHGDIVETGSHRELLQADGYYKRLYELLSTPLPF